MGTIPKGLWVRSSRGKITNICIVYRYIVVPGLSMAVRRMFVNCTNSKMGQCSEIEMNIT